MFIGKFAKYTRLVEKIFASATILSSLQDFIGMNS
jgi:hypothetical protein